MPMTLISGEWGVGKTRYLAEKLQEFSLSGAYCISNFKHVYTNNDRSMDTPEEFIKNLGMLVEMKMRGREPHDIFRGFQFSSIAIFIDEVTLYFGPEMQDRLKKRDEKSYDRLQSLLAQVRKFDIDIFCTCQTPSRVGKDFRRLFDDYINMRWVISMPYYVSVKHPHKDMYRMELRNRIPLLWIEHHDLDIDNPRFNYKQQRLENGRMVDAPSSTLTMKPKLYWAGGKQHQFDLYDSYQPIGTGGKTEEDVDFRFLLEESSFIPPFNYKKERFPTFKNIANWVGFNFRHNDKDLPPRIRLVGANFHKEGQEARISKVNEQKQYQLDVNDSNRLVIEAFARGKPLPVSKLVELATVAPGVRDEQAQRSQREESDADEAQNMTNKLHSVEGE